MMKLPDGDLFLSVIPAHSGTFLIGMDAGCIWKDPVIGWVIKGHFEEKSEITTHWAEPVTDGVQHYSDICILHPDGRVALLGGTTFDNVDEWREFMMKEKAA